ncbi:uncharacterized protein CEXT_33811 [Caerostris extrusa]|uniref:Uncharacterized protein n=1 Tax=Caerostris extrusa TaxID=172846 RepID=A0AAV4UCL2_CAEEX|nr:uncharacterized protein CEXT_33811 [Caerostris extrusa]
MDVKTSTSKVPSLYDKCMMRTLANFKEGFWRGNRANPFVLVPSDIVDDLVRIRDDLCPGLRPSIAQMHLLFSSGRLTIFDLMRLFGDCIFPLSTEVVRLMTPDVCRNLRDITIPFLYTEVIPKLLECPNLEVLRTQNVFRLRLLKNCPNLCIIRIHDKHAVKLLKCPWNFEDLPFFGKSLEIFDVFRMITPNKKLNKVLARIFLNSPKLISLGLIDTSLALHSIHELYGTNDPPQFVLKRAFWGIADDADPEDIPLDRAKYPTIIKQAVFSCPLLQELIIQVFHMDCVPHLRHLKHLSVLSINFAYCYEDPNSAFLNLLRDIGYHLRHLSVETGFALPVNTVLKLCPYLETLEVCGSVTVSRPVQRLNSLRCLKRLRVNSIDKPGLIFVFSHCFGLEDVFTHYALDVDDDTLEKILKKKRLPNLKSLHITSPNLTYRGLQKLLDTSPSLRNVYVPCHKSLVCTSRGPIRTNLYTKKPDYFSFLMDKHRF